MKLFYKIIIVIAILFLLDFAIGSFMQKGVDRFYGIGQPSKILLLGHSHLMLATDKAEIERQLDVKISKYCREGVNVEDRSIMTKHYLNSPNADSLKVVLYGVDPFTFTGEGLSQNSYKLFFPFIGDSVMNAYLKTQATSQEYWLNKLFRAARYNDDGVKNAALRGWMNNWDNMKFGTIDPETYRLKLQNRKERSIQMNPSLIKTFEQTVETFTKRGCRVILVNPPTYYMLNEYEPEKYEAIIKWFQDFAEADSLVEFWDLTPEYAHQTSIFRDAIHVNREGQKIISQEIVKRLSEIPELR